MAASAEAQAHETLTVGPPSGSPRVACASTAEALVRAKARSAPATSPPCSARMPAPQWRMPASVVPITAPQRTGRAAMSARSAGESSSSIAPRRSASARAAPSSSPPWSGTSPAPDSTVGRCSSDLGARTPTSPRASASTIASSEPPSAPRADMEVITTRALMAATPVPSPMQPAAWPRSTPRAAPATAAPAATIPRAAPRSTPRSPMR